MATETNIELIPAGAYSTKGGFQIDGSLVKWWATKPQAIAGAKAIGWPVLSVTTVHTRFQIGYALLGTFGGLVSKGAYARLLDRDEQCSFCGDDFRRCPCDLESAALAAGRAVR